MQISVRGMSYIWSYNKAEFLQQCAALAVEFILPTAAHEAQQQEDRP